LILGIPLGTRANSLAGSLDELREDVRHFFESPAIGAMLGATAAEYEDELAARSHLSETFRDHRVQHLNDRELVVGLRRLANVATRSPMRVGQNAPHLTPFEDGSRSLLDRDSGWLFRVLCAAYLAPGWRNWRVDQVDQELGDFVKQLREMQRRRNLVWVANSLFNLRQAVERGLPLSAFALAIVLLATVMGLTMSHHAVWVEWFVRVLVGVLFLQALLIGFYIFQISSRYFQRDDDAV
jgi:hypothetical protein